MVGVSSGKPEKIGVWRSLVARQFWVLDVVGSNPITPTLSTAPDDFTKVKTSGAVGVALVAQLDRAAVF